MNAVARDIAPEAARTCALRALRQVAARKSEWQIDRDLMRGRSLDFSRKLLPDGLSLLERVDFLNASEARLSQPDPGSHVCLSLRTGRTLHQREDALHRPPRTCWAIRTRSKVSVRFSSDELKHQELFRRMEQMIGCRDACRLRGWSRIRTRCAAVLGRECLGGAGPHLPYRIVRAVPLRTEHRSARGSVPVVQGCIPLSLA